MESHSCDRHGIRSVFGLRRPPLSLRRPAKCIFAAVLFTASFTANFGTGQYAQVAPNQAWAAGIRPDGQSSLLVATPRSAAPHGLTGGTASPEKGVKGDILHSYGKLPLSFEPNQGQSNSKAQFLARGNGYTLFLTGDAAILALRSGGRKNETRKSEPENRAHHSSIITPDSPAQTGDGSPATNAVVQMRLFGGKQNSAVAGLDELPGKSNYLIGNDPKAWRTNIPTYGKVMAKNVYNGVDLVYYGNQGLLEYDFIVAPGADPSVIQFAIGSAAPVGSRQSEGRKSSLETQSSLLYGSSAFSTHHSLRLATNGDLLVKINGGEVRLHKPVVYQPAGSDNGSRSVIEGRYVRLQRNRIGFQLGPYDHRRALVIDPALGYSTFLGGSSYDQGNAIAVDASGDAYVAGSTQSANFPVSTGALQTVSGGATDAFVTELNPSGSAAVYSTYLGGSGSDSAQSIALDSSNDVFLTGNTGSTNFPTTPGAFQTTCGDCRSGAGAFVTKLNPGGTALVYSTYLSGNTNDYGYGIAVDGSGNAYVTGYTDSSNFPVTAGAFEKTFAGLQDAFVTKVNSAGSGLVYSTFLSGINTQRATAIALDAAADAYVVGFTSSDNFPTTAGSFQVTCGAACGDNDGFATELDPAGAHLVYSTYLGGSLGASVYGIALDSSGDAYLTGATPSTDFPVTAGAFQTACGGGCAGSTVDAFVAKLKSNGSTLLYATYLGGSSNDQGNGIAVDSSGDAYVTGITFSADFPTTPGAYRTSCAGNCAAGKAFLTEFNPTGSTAIDSTYLGGTSADNGTGIAIDSAGNPYVVGYTYSSDFPVTPGAFQTVCGGCTNADDAFVTKFVPGIAPAPAIVAFGNQAVGVASAAQTITLSNSSAATLSITSIAITGTDPTDFADTTTCGSSLTVGSSCTISVTFTPPSIGAFSADVTITDDAPNSPQTVALSGTGQELVQVSGNVSEIQVGGNGSVFAINSAQQIYSFNTQTQTWVQIPGALVQLSVGADGLMCGANATHQVWCYDSANGTWNQLSGAALTQVTVGYTNVIWGLNATGQIYRYHPGTGGWDLIPGALAQIAIGPDGSVWGINSANSVYHFNPRKQAWDQIPGALLTQIAVGYGGVVWGVNAQGQIYQFSTATQNFTLIPGIATQLSVGRDGTVWVAHAGQYACYRYDPSAQGSWDTFPTPAPISQVSVGYAGAVWAADSSGGVFELQAVTPAPAKTLQQVAGSLAQVSVAGDGNVWGVNSAGQIYAFNSETQAWDAVSGTLTQIAVGFGGAVWGINSAHQIYSFNPATQSWTQIPGALTQIAVGSANAVWGINAAGQVYQYTGGQWYLRSGLTATQIAVAPDGTVWGLNASQQIYSYSSQTQKWQLVAGSLTEIAVGSSRAIWGVNAAGSIYTYSTQTQSWSQIPGQLKQVGVGADGVGWGFNNAGMVYEYDSGTGDWNQIIGSQLSAIAVGADEVVWGLNGNQIYRAH